MAKFPSISFNQVAMVFIFGYFAVLAVTKLLESFGWIQPKANLGVGFFIIMAAIVMIAAYRVVVVKSFQLSFTELVVLIMLIGGFVAFAMFFNMLFPTVFTASLEQFKVVAMSTFGGG